MTTFDSNSIQQAIDHITDINRDNDGFVSVEFTNKERIVVRYTNDMYRPHNHPKSISIFSTSLGKEVEILVSFETGPEIKELFGDIRTHPPANINHAEVAGEMGGDECRNANSMNYYGTITLFVTSFQTIADRQCTMNCTAAPALISCNHVIARSDAGKLGEVIWTPFRGDLARLKCFAPFSCQPPVDIATATVNDISGISKWTIRSIGQVAGFRRPNIGEAIKKHGARTSYTTGAVTGIANIRVGGNIFNGVFSTTGGFGCGGDSGSAVVAGNNNLLGVFSWGDDIPCEQSPRGYFWTFVDPGFSDKNSDLSRYSFLFDSVACGQK